MRVTMDDGVALEVTDTGSGPGLLLVHGFGGAKEDFDRVMFYVARNDIATANKEVDSLRASAPRLIGSSCCISP